MKAIGSIRILDPVSGLLHVLSIKGIQLRLGRIFFETEVEVEEATTLNLSGELRVYGEDNTLIGFMPNGATFDDGNVILNIAPGDTFTLFVPVPIGRIGESNES